VARSLRELAARHGVRPRKSLGQHFLVDPNLARSIVRWAGVGPGDRVLEIGAGLGSLTMELARAAERVVAVEVDPAAVAALRDVTEAAGNVDVVVGDALRLEWGSVLGDHVWKMVSNLPYNVAVPVTMELLEGAPQVTAFTVMVQREVGERLVAAPGDPQYGSVSVRVAYHATAATIRRVPPSVFWPEPNVESVIVRLDRRPPPVPTPRDELFRVVEEGFAQRRKTMRNALIRLGLGRPVAERALAACGLERNVRAERLGLTEFACLAERIRG
jgi:16S rRNA (adenine1518-N6/adenine1519-N6)-dimethyltransferase